LTAVAIVLVVIAGLAGAVQAAVMGTLGERTGTFPALAFSGIVSVVFGLALLLAAKQSLRGISDVVHQPVWLWTGGALSVLIIVAIAAAHRARGDDRDDHRPQPRSRRADRPLRLVRLRPHRAGMGADCGPRAARRGSCADAQQEWLTSSSSPNASNTVLLATRTRGLRATATDRHATRNSK